MKKCAKIIFNFFLFVTLFYYSTQKVFATSDSTYPFLNIDDSISSNPKLIPFIKSTIQKLPPKMIDAFQAKQIKIIIGQMSKGSSFENENSSHEYASVERIKVKEYLILLEPYFTYSLDNLNLDDLTVKTWLEKREVFYNRNAILNKDLSIPKHQNAFKMLEGIIIHEISHIYDLMNVPFLFQILSYSKCLQAATAGEPNSAQPECVAFNKMNTSLSTLPEFLHAAGWPDRGFLSPDHEFINNNASGSLNYYESKNTYEAVAVNLEFYILDPQFQCHKPNLFHFFYNYFDGYSPFPNVICNNTKKILISNTDILMGKENKKEHEKIFDFVELDESKLYEIHYFYAGKNDEMMSKFGHGMLRLVFCAPERKTVGPECIKDTNYHIVASFAAFIGDVQINPLDGLFGGYAAHLFMSKLSTTLDTYNDTELREIYSLPLKLTPAQKHILLNALYEAHWSYRGSYSFLSKNCAIETHSVIKSAFLFDPKILHSYTVRPDLLYELLKELKIANGYIFDDPKKAFDYKYFIPSKRSKYEASIKRLVEFGILAEGTDLDNYIDLSPEERTLNIEKARSIKNRIDRGIAIVASQELESLSLRRYYQDTLKDKLPDIINKLQEEGSVNGIKKSEVVDLLKKLSIPSETLKLTESYGIPNAESVDEKIKEVTEQFNPQFLIDLRTNVLEFVKSCLDQEQVERIIKYSVNLDLLKKD